MVVRPVNKEDCGNLEGSDITPLRTAVKQVCPGLKGDVLWAEIREAHDLGFVDCDSWVRNMNAAIKRWNEENPKDCEAIRSIFRL